MKDLTNTQRHPRKVDTGEFELPETVFVRDIENHVFQSIILQCLAKIDGVGLVEGNFIDHILGRSSTERVKGIDVEQDSKNQTVGIKIEINVLYGISIPAKAEEIHSKVTEEITRLTGLHVAYVHLVFKNILPTNATKKLLKREGSAASPTTGNDQIEEEYTDEF